MFAHTELCPFTRHGSRQSPQRLFSDVVVDGAGMRVDADERALVDDRPQPLAFMCGKALSMAHFGPKGLILKDP